MSRRDDVRLYFTVGLAIFKGIAVAEKMVARRKMRKQLENYIKESQQEIIDVEDYVVYPA